MPESTAQTKTISGTPRCAVLMKSLQRRLDEFPPEVRKAAVFVLEHPDTVGFSSIREIAAAANVKPNTFVRLAREVDQIGYDEFRSTFREALITSGDSFPERAQALQSVSQGGHHEALFHQLASGAAHNIHRTFADTSAEAIKAAADAIVAARKTWVLGVGINHSLAQSFAYLADMAIDSVRAIPRDGNLAIDDLARANAEDVLLAMTFKPYRTEVVDAVQLAQEQGVTVIGISDSLAAPILAKAQHSFVVPTDSAQFFTSVFSTAALLETLMAFVVADAKPSVIRNIKRYHEHRYALGIYATQETRTHGK